MAGQGIRKTGDLATLRAIAARGMPSLDLFAVRLIYNGAEPIAPALVHEFLGAMYPAGLSADTMFPDYGLAEASLTATFPQPETGLRGLRVVRGELGVGERVCFDDSADVVELVCLGAPVAGSALRIADADGDALADDTVRRIWIRSDNVTAGYDRNAQANHEACMGDGWLDTGDLGFVHDGDLVITGRAKEIIFVHGENHYPQDLEAIAQTVDGVELNKIAAAGVRPPGGDADKLVMFGVFCGHFGDFMPLARNLTATLNRYAGLAVARVLPAWQLPKTTSGKLQRSLLTRDYAQGVFASIVAELDERMRAGSIANDHAEYPADIVRELKVICDEIVPDHRIGYDDDLFEIGLSSLELAQIYESIEARWPDRLEVTDLFDYFSINALATLLGESKAA